MKDAAQPQEGKRRKGRKAVRSPGLYRAALSPLAPDSCLRSSRCLRSYAAAAAAAA